MNTLGLIGFPIAHSKSPDIFRCFFEKSDLTNHWVYNLFSLEKISQLPALLQNNKDLRGFNVTIPYKQDILSYLHKKDKSVIESGAANTVIVERVKGEAILSGYNTDVFGFKKSLMEFVSPLNKKVLILGNGGSSKAVLSVLSELNIPFTQVSRYPAVNMIGYAEITKEHITDHLIIVNTTPLGMWPNTETFPNIPYDYINHNHYCFDLVYNPEETMFMKQCLKKNATVCNGLAMLQYQADAAWKLFMKNGI